MFFSQFTFAQDVNTVVCTIPAGSDVGVTYANVGTKETNPSGPEAFTIDDNGNFIIEDTVAGRLLYYSKTCAFIGSIELPKEAFYAIDVKFKNGLWVLSSEAHSASIWHLSLTGNVLDKIISPIGLNDGLTGFSIGKDHSLVMIKNYGEFTLPIEPITASNEAKPIKFINGIIKNGIQYTAKVYEDHKSGTLYFGKKEIIVNVNNPLLSLSIFAINDDGSVYVSVDEGGYTTEKGVNIISTIRRYSADGLITGVANIPNDGDIETENSLSLDNKGNVYEISSQISRMKITKLVFVPFYEIKQLVFKQFINNNSSQLNTNGNINQSWCSIFRPNVLSIADEYVNNSTNISQDSIDGNSCQNRTKPPYLKNAAIYSSVSYAWGGFDSISSFNSRMTQNIAAGNVNASNAGLYATRQCPAAGIDCSGFVSRVWSLIIHNRTSDLFTIAHTIDSIEHLRGGDALDKNNSHVRLFDTSNGNETTVYESSASVGGYVIHRPLNLKFFNGFIPIRYNKICDFVNGNIWCQGYSPVASFDFLGINFGGGNFKKEKITGSDYDGTPLYLEVSGSYARSTKALTLSITTYTDSSYTNVSRKDDCNGTWDDSSITNTYSANCTKIIGDAGDCPGDINMNIDNPRSSPANPINSARHVTYKENISNIKYIKYIVRSAC